MKNQHFAVIGLGRFGTSVALTLAEQGCEVSAVDIDETRVKAVSEKVTLAMQLDAMDPQALKGAGIEDVDVAIVSIGDNVEASILITMMLKDMGIKRILAKAINEMHGRVLTKIGVEKVIYPEKDMGYRVANSLIMPELIEYLALSPEYSIVEIPTPEFLLDKAIKSTNLREEFGVNIVAIKRKKMIGGIEKDSWDVNPLPSDIIRKGDVLVVLGANKHIEKLR